MLSVEDNGEDENFVDPVLEKIRNEGLESSRVDYDKMAKDLREDVEGVHAGYLFEAVGRESLKQICIKMSASFNDIYCSNWRDLGAECGLSFDKISCIEGYNTDYTQLVFLAFCQKNDASLSRLVIIFHSLQRYDVLSIASKHFPAIADFARKQHGSKNNTSFPIQEGGVKELLKPHGLAVYKRLLPFTLQDEKPDKMTEKGSTMDYERRLEVIQKECSAPFYRPHLSNKATCKGKKVMLTYASDCLELAKKLAQEFRKKREDFPPFRVLMLEEHADVVNLNPVDFIAHQFKKMDFIIPILSERYFQCICNNIDLWSMDHLDERYAKLIFNFMNSYYLENGCINAKVRTIIPRCFEDAVFNNKHFEMYVVLKSFRFDDDDKIEEMIHSLAKFRYH